MNEDDTRKALNMMNEYRITQVCYVERTRPVMTYLLSDNNAPTCSLHNEDCVQFRPSRLNATGSDDGWYKLENHDLMHFFNGNKKMVDEGIYVIKKYGYTYSCHVGRPSPEFGYFRR